MRLQRARHPCFGSLRRHKGGRQQSDTTHQYQQGYLYHKVQIRNMYQYSTISSANDLGVTQVLKLFDAAD
jgi:hypothetical protein